MNVEHIIIQAGGKGTRLDKLTKNKPKGIVPIMNLPIIFHLFKKYPQKKFVIIGDYLFSVLENYMYAFCDVNYLLVRANDIGTCGGLAQSIALIPDKPFMIVWSDLLLPETFSFDNLMEGVNYVGISKDFICRWSYQDGDFVEIPSAQNGVAGLFIFENKRLLADVPLNGEFVKWLGSTDILFSELPLHGTQEVGTLDAFYEAENTKFRCRPFNELHFENGAVRKIPLDKQGELLASREIRWYQEVAKYGFCSIPKILSYDPLLMEEINGQNIFKADLSEGEKKLVLSRIVSGLNELHGYKKCMKDIFSIQEAYYNKTFKRIEKVRDLIPFANEPYIEVNGRKCKNILLHKGLLQDKIRQLCYDSEFTLIHGDCTFSNTMIDDDLQVIFLDPRGYFGHTELCGDVYYDWAKVYYSLVGDYDRFNNKEFTLDISKDSVCLQIKTNGWKATEDYFFSLIPNINIERLKLIHAIIWISLTTYAWEDYDSICGAFYNGIYLLEDLL